MRRAGGKGSGGARTLFIAATLLFATVSGCGGGGGTGASEVDTDATTTPADVTFPEPTAPKGSPQPPKGASDVLKEIYRQFTLRKPDPRVKGSARAIAAGRAACAGRTPVEVERRYYPIAVEKGNIDPNSDQGRMIAEVGKYAKTVAKDPSFVAGQLAADAYQATLPPRVATFGYAGCAYALARQVEKQLAP